MAKSTTETEYVALRFATQEEAIWLRQYREDMGLKEEGLTRIYEDNNGAIELSKNHKFHDHTKHIDVTHHFVREHVAQNSISVKYCCCCCSTQNMLADGMTKGLSKDTFQRLRDLLVGVKAV